MRCLRPQAPAHKACSTRSHCALQCQAVHSADDRILQQPPSPKTDARTRSSPPRAATRALRKAAAAAAAAPIADIATNDLGVSCPAGLPSLDDIVAQLSHQTANAASALHALSGSLAPSNHSSRQHRLPGDLYRAQATGLESFGLHAEASTSGRDELQLQPSLRLHTDLEFTVGPPLHFTTSNSRLSAVSKRNFIINGALLQAESLQQLAAVIVRDHAEFEEINTATAWWKLARLHRSTLSTHGSQHASSVYHKHVAPCIKVLTKLSTKNAACFSARDVAITTWACASLSHTNRAHLQALMAAAADKLFDFTPQDCTHIVWACASLRYRDASALLVSVSEFAVQKLALFKPQELAMLLWGLAKLRVRLPDYVLDAVLQYTIDNMTAFATRNVVNVVWAYARLSSSMGAAHYGAAFMAAAREHLMQNIDSCTAQDCANVMWSFAKLNEDIGELGMLVTERALQQITHFTTQEIANLVYACGKLRVVNMRLLHAVEDAVVCNLSSYKDQELGMLMWGLSKLRYEASGELLHAWRHELLLRGPRLDAGSCCSAVKALVGLDMQPDAAFLLQFCMVCERHLHAFGPCEYSSLLRMCAKAGVSSPAVVDAALSTTAEHIVARRPTATRFFVKSTIDAASQLGYDTTHLVRIAAQHGFR